LCCETFETVKIADFGCAVQADQQGTMTSNLGTPAYMAPELVADSRRVQVDSAKVDVYSFGVLMWAMYSRQRPYADMKCVNMFTMMNQIVDGKRPLLAIKQPQLKGAREGHKHSRGSLMRSQSTPDCTLGIGLASYASSADDDSIADVALGATVSGKAVPLQVPASKLQESPSEDPSAASSRPLLPVVSAVEFPPLLGSLIQRCWAADPTSRPDFSMIAGELQHPDLVAEVHAQHEPRPAAPAMDWSNARDNTNRQRMPQKKVGRVRSKLRFPLPLRRTKSTGMPGSLSQSAVPASLTSIPHIRRGSSASEVRRQEGAVQEGAVFSIAEEDHGGEAQEASGTPPVRLDELTDNLANRASPKQ
jgi:serine/threonine protein kinase